MVIEKNLVGKHRLTVYVNSQMTKKEYNELLERIIKVISELRINTRERLTNKELRKISHILIGLKYSHINY